MDQPSVSKRAKKECGKEEADVDDSDVLDPEFCEPRSSSYQRSLEMRKRKQRSKRRTDMDSAASKAGSSGLLMAAKAGSGILKVAKSGNSGLQKVGEAGSSGLQKVGEAGSGSSGAVNARVPRTRMEGNQKRNISALFQPESPFIQEDLKVSGMWHRVMGVCGMMMVVWCEGVVV